MEPTLLVGDHILVNKFIYGVKMPFTRTTLIPVKEPGRDEVIVFIYPVEPDKDFIKRVIGLPGDRIELSGQRIYVNGTLHEDKYGVYTARHAEAGRPSSWLVPEGHVFVMGDNRDHSYDSRFWGFVPIASIKGKAFIIYWSWPHWKRFFHLIK